MLLHVISFKFSLFHYQVLHLQRILTVYGILFPKKLLKMITVMAYMKLVNLLPMSLASKEL